jgi:aminoglycoside phosphotransferase (APT) family kinase protein
MSALAETDVPVPMCLGYCNDPEITGAPFYVMSFVEGRILRDRASVADMTSAEADIATDSLIEAQIAFHTVDLDAIGLSNLARHDDYVGRQLTRWQRQVEQDHNRPLPLLTELHDRLVAAKPPETARPGLAHGDYRFDNTVLDEKFQVCAILDWELCTIGNPIADFAWSLEYWAGAGDSLTFLADPPTAAEIFVDRDEVARRYAQRSGLDLSDLPYYRVFSWWRMSCIVEGSYGRSLRGSRGGGPGGQNSQHIADRVEMQLARAAELAVGVL